jgi:hypothetical protein
MDSKRQGRRLHSIIPIQETLNSCGGNQNNPSQWTHGKDMESIRVWTLGKKRRRVCLNPERKSLGFNIGC